MNILNKNTIGNNIMNLITEYFDNPSITKMANNAYKVISNPKIQSLKPKFNCNKARHIIAKKWRPSYLSLFKKTRSFPL